MRRLAALLATFAAVLLASCGENRSAQVPADSTPEITVRIPVLAGQAPATKPASTEKKDSPPASNPGQAAQNASSDTGSVPTGGVLHAGTGAALPTVFINLGTTNVGPAAGLRTRNGSILNQQVLAPEGASAKASLSKDQSPPAVTTKKANNKKGAESKKTTPATRSSRGPTTTPKVPDPPSSTATPGTAAFESALPIGTDPVISAVGQYAYALFATDGLVPAVPPPPKPGEQPAPGGTPHQSSPFAPFQQQGEMKRISLLGDVTRPGAGCQPLPGAQPPESECPGQGGPPLLPPALPAAVPPLAACPGRRVAFFAVKYAPLQTQAITTAQRLAAARAGAHAVRTQLVSLYQPGLRQTVELKASENVALGICSFDDDGANARFGWLALERQPGGQADWARFASSDGAFAPHHFGYGDTLADYKMILQANTPLDPPNSPRYPGGPDPLSRAVFSVVLAANRVTFAIEVKPEPSPDPRVPALHSFHITGDYHRIPGLSPQSVDALPDELLQLGAVVLRSALPLQGRTPEARALVRRAAEYGSDVLRRRGETFLTAPVTPFLRLGDNRHLVLFARNTRSGETSWLAVLADGTVEQQIVQNGTRKGPGPHEIVPIPPPPRPWLAPPLIAPQPAESYPLFLGGDGGFRLIEVLLVRKPRVDGAYRVARTPLLDVQFLFVDSQLSNEAAQ